ncbi:hypothetical protein GBAR_LOCUS7934 [Geodia barretti]|uniref:Uncharacterized protein n=1 Tax=Geodia barretti TaxID=519541 RepID=A0AA35RJP4_GEOBA|nr:hypothetical protein GBAR_LOCUS7934 [Geodia barretti]
MSGANCSPYSPSATFLPTRLSRSPRAPRPARRSPSATTSPSGARSRRIRLRRRRFGPVLRRAPQSPRFTRPAPRPRAASSSTTPRSSAWTRTCRWWCPR